ncbi:MAG: hypothetical protein OXG15_07185 [Gammaproteobacteria bacterium]|nr:hypothetical protein [Gammaproteobacteria bacterium]
MADPEQKLDEVGTEANLKAAIEAKGFIVERMTLLKITDYCKSTYEAVWTAREKWRGREYPNFTAYSLEELAQMAGVKRRSQPPVWEAL